LRISGSGGGLVSAHELILGNPHQGKGEIYEIHPEERVEVFVAASVLGRVGGHMSRRPGAGGGTEIDGHGNG
jgi:hypothetical protein